MSFESVMPSNHLLLCLPFSSSLQSFPASGSFQTSQCFQNCHSVLQFNSVQLFSCVRLFVTPWTAARQDSLSITIPWRLLKLITEFDGHIKSVMPSNHLILCCLLLLLPSIFPSIRSFPVSQFFASAGQIIRVSASTSVLPVNIHD